MKALVLLLLSVSCVCWCKPTTVVSFSPVGYSPGVAPGFAYAFRAPAPLYSPAATPTGRSLLSRAFSNHIGAPAHVPTVLKTQYHSQDELGQYAFGYVGDASTAHEVRTMDGAVRGSYTYVDSDGELQTASYIADRNGFRVEASNLPKAPPAPSPVVISLPKPVKHTPEVEAATAAHLRAVAEVKAARAKRATLSTSYLPPPPSPPVKLEPVKPTKPVKEQPLHVPAPTSDLIPPTYSKASILPPPVTISTPVVHPNHIPLTLSPPVPVANPNHIPVTLSPPVPVAHPNHIPLTLSPPVPVANPNHIPLTLSPPVPVAHPNHIPLTHSPPVPVAHPNHIPLTLSPPVPVAHPNHIPLTLSPPKPVAHPNHIPLTLSPPKPVAHPNHIHVTHSPPAAVVPHSTSSHALPAPNHIANTHSVFVKANPEDLRFVAPVPLPTSLAAALASPVPAPVATGPVVGTSVVAPQILSQFHAQDELGGFEYGYEGGPSSKHEVHFPDDVTRGSYSYIDANGELQTVSYVADDVYGFRVLGSNLPEVPAVPYQ